MTLPFLVLGPHLNVKVTPVIKEFSFEFKKALNFINNGKLAIRACIEKNMHKNGCKIPVKLSFNAKDCTE